MSVLTVWLVGVPVAWVVAIRLMVWDFHRHGLTVERKDARVFAVLASASALIWPAFLIFGGISLLLYMMLGPLASWVAGVDRAA